MQLEWCHEFYNTERKHSSANMMSPINYEKITVLHPGRRHREDLHDSGEAHNRDL